MGVNTICILMATYKGKKYITDQINSIRNQTYTDWELYINDDGSKDGTVDDIEKLVLVDSRIHLVNLDDGMHGQLYNFDKLMKYVAKLNSDYKYFMFSDQDDIWYKRKIENTLNFMQSHEKKYSLVYTNYDENRKNGEVEPRYSKEFHKKYKDSQLLVQNWIMGCTMMINRNLLLISTDIPIEAENHDNWIMLLALTYGNIFYLNEVTMFHRIHADNVTNNFNKMNLLRKIKGLVERISDKKSFRDDKRNLMKQILSLSIPRKEKYVLKYEKILESKHKIGKIWNLYINGISGLNVHKTLELWIKI